MKKYLPECGCVIAKNKLFDYDPLVLSLVGDGVHTLFVRSMLAQKLPFSAGGLHNETCRAVCASAQAAAAKRIEGILDEDEAFIYKKCKNATARNLPKHATLMEYKYATALEGLIGYLYLSGLNQRLSQIIETAYADQGLNT